MEQELYIEIWKDIFEFDGLYQVSTHGRVKRLQKTVKRGRGIGASVILPDMILSPRNSSKGYLRVTLHKGGKMKTFNIHRLVAETFIPNPDKKFTVNHKDGNKHNNLKSNLEWNTSKENIEHSILNDLRGDTGACEYHGNAKLTNDQVLEIRKLFATGEYLKKELGEMFGVCGGTITYVISKGWNKLNKQAA